VPEAVAATAPAVENPFKVTVGAGLRAGLRIQNPNLDDDGNKLKLNDQFLDELNAELRFSGKVTDIIGWTANLTVDGRTRAEAAGGAPIAFQAQALDLITQLDVMDEFHVWLGRMLTPSDRSNFSGAWFMMPWNYSGIFDDGAVFPRGTEEVGREVGVTVWGDIGKGKFKYYAAALDLDSNFGNAGMQSQSPLFALRAQYAFIGAEPGFYGSSTYYGSQDVVALGASFRVQNDFASGLGEDDMTEFNFDLLAEFATDAGTITGEAAYYHGDGESINYNDFFYVLAGYTTKEPVGPGKLNASVRYQQGMFTVPEVPSDVDAMGNPIPGRAEFDVTRHVIEPSIAYLFKDYFAKLQLTYSYGVSAPEDGDNYKYNMLQLGFQIQQ
jgi:hypothetical protein